MEGSIDRPAGSPMADQVRVCPDPESVAVVPTGVMAVPDTSVWSPGEVTDTVSVTVHANVADPE